MPGLVGFVGDHPLDPGLIRALADPLRHRPTYQLTARTDGAWAMATVDLAAGRSLDSLGIPPCGYPRGASQAHWAESTDGRYRLVGFGAIYESWAHDGAGLGAELLLRWRTSGSQALTHLNGEYLIAVWDRDEQRLTIVNDRLGLKRLHLWHDHSTLAFSSELKSLAVLPSVSRVINEQALAELLTFGHVQEDRTLLRDVRLLPPASVLTWQRGSVSTTSYWRYVFQADPALEDPARAVDEYAHRVETAVARRLQGRGRIGLLLSGGLDSRTLAGMTRRLRPREALWTWTTGHAHAHDVRYAKQIARVIESRHTTVEIPQTFLQDFGPEYAWVLDGMVTTHGAHRSCVLEALEAMTDVLLIGYLGDHISGGTPLDKVLHVRTLKELLVVSYPLSAVGFDDDLLARTLRREVYERVFGLAREVFARKLAEAPVEHLADRVVWADLTQRQRLWNPLALMDLLGLTSRVATPFSDREFVDFIRTLPVSQRMQKRAYRGMICQALPQLARVPRAGDGLPLIHSRLRASLHWRRVLFERHTLPRLTGGRFGGHAYGSFVHCGEWFRASSRHFIEATLLDNPLLEEHFRMEALHGLVREFLDGTSKRDLMECIASLMSVALFRERLDHVPVYHEQRAAACAAS